MFLWTKIIQRTSKLSMFFSLKHFFILVAISPQVVSLLLKQENIFMGIIFFITLQGVALLQIILWGCKAGLENKISE